MALWERVEAGGQRAEQRHREVLRLYSDLQQQQLVSAQNGGDESWPRGRLEQLRARLDQEGRQREQVRPWTHRDLVLVNGLCEVMSCERKLITVVCQQMDSFELSEM